MARSPPSGACVPARAVQGSVRAVFEIESQRQGPVRERGRSCLGRAQGGPLMTSSRSVVLAAPVRTAIGTFGGSLKEVSASDLGAVAIGAAVERAGLEPDEIGTVVMGNVIQAGSKMNPARQAAINAGLPVSVPAMTVNRVCGSGAQAIVSAAHRSMARGGHGGRYRRHGDMGFNA